MNTRLSLTLLLLLTGTAGFAAPFQEPTRVPPTIPSVSAAQREFETIKKRYVAGVATPEEMEQAQAALTMAQAETQLQAARAQYERRLRMVRAGVSSTDALEESQLSVTASEVALLQTRLSRLQKAAARQQAITRAGIGSAKEADAATIAPNATQAELVKAQARYREQHIALLKSRFLSRQRAYKAGIGSQADVECAQTEYEAAQRSL